MKKRIIARLPAFMFRPIDENSPEERSLGWVSVTDPFRYEISEHEALLGDHLVLSLRMDRKTVPPRLLKYTEQAAIRRLLEERGTERIGRREKKEIRERARQSLLRKALPSIRVFDLDWDLSRDLVLFSSTSESVCEALATVFEETFEVGLVRESSFTVFSDKTKGGSSALDDVRPSRMA